MTGPHVGMRVIVNPDDEFFFGWGRAEVERWKGGNAGRKGTITRINGRHKHLYAISVLFDDNSSGWWTYPRVVKPLSDKADLDWRVK